MALANPDISFKLINDTKDVFKSNGSGNINDVIYLLYGKEIKDNIINVNYEEEDIKITGVIGNTLVAKENRKEQIIFLNKRNIKNQILTNSADQAFKGSIGIGKYGFFILNLEMPACFYDINVHPTKMEVRFNNEGKIYKILYHAIKNAILNKDFLGNNEVESSKEIYVEDEYKFLTNHFESATKVRKDTEGQLVNPLKKENILDKNIRFIGINNIDKKLDSSNSNVENLEYINNSKEIISRDNKREVKYKYIGILMRTYIIIEVQDEIFLIDQHAGHERVLYEQIKENYKEHLNSNSQMMLVPEIINLTHKEMEFVKENIELFKNYGFDIEPFGENTVKINGIPDIEYRVNSKNMFLEVLDEMLTNERSSIKDVEERFIATVACKAAVKANMDLLPKEVDNLIQSLLQLQNPYTCPHGRPTTIKLRKEEMI